MALYDWLSLPILQMIIIIKLRFFFFFFNFYIVQVYLSQFWRLESPRSRCWQTAFKVSLLLFLAIQQQLSLCGPFLHDGCWERGRLVRTLIPSQGFHPDDSSKPNCLSRASPPNSIILGIESLNIWIWVEQKYSGHNNNHFQFKLHMYS